MSGVYYPCVAAVFTLRFDELLLNGKLPPLTSAKSLAKGGAITFAGPPSAKGELLGGARDRLTKKIGVIPRQSSIELPGYRQAPKFSMTLSWRDLPLDPRAVRALGVEIYVGALDSTKYARSMLSRGGGLAADLVADPANLILAGVCDTVGTDFGERGATVELEGRGLQGIFLDARIHPDTLVNLPVVQPIDQLVMDVLGRAGMGARVPVVADPPSEWPGGQIPSVATTDVVTRINKGADGTKPTMPTKGESSTILFWDVVTNFCFLVGAVPYFEGHTLRLRPAQNLYQRKKAAARGVTPFKGSKPRSVRTDKGSEQFSLRRMVYGRNLLNFKLQRKLAGASKLPTVRIVCNDPDSAQGGPGQVLEAQWPEETASDEEKASSVEPSGGSSKQEVLTIPVYGIKSKVRLRQIARATYEEIARGELSGSASTKDLASLAGDNSDADLLRLRPGDPVEFLVDGSGLRNFPPIVSEANNLAASSPGEAVRLLAEQLGDRDLAEILVGTARGQFVGLQDFFHVQTAKYSWEVSAGLAVDFDFQNYVEARVDSKPRAAESLDEVVQNIVDAAETALEKAKALEPKAASVPRPRVED